MPNDGKAGRSGSGIPGNESDSENGSPRPGIVMLNDNDGSEGKSGNGMPGSDSDNE